jgi:hypothetical protein
VEMALFFSASTGTSVNDCLNVSRTVPPGGSAAIFASLKCVAVFVLSVKQSVQVAVNNVRSTDVSWERSTVNNGASQLPLFQAAAPHSYP